jgi:hypothetical protein
MMRILVAILACAAVAAIGLVVILGGRAGGERAPAQPSGDQPAATAPAAAPDDDVPEDALGLRNDPPEERFKGRPGMERRSAANLESAYKIERKHRLQLADQLIAYLTPRLGLSPAKAQALRQAIIARGDAARVGYYRKRGGAATPNDAERARDEAARVFDKALPDILTPDQLPAFRMIEEEAKTEDGQDLGFGTLYGKGGGGERWKEEPPQPKTAGGP